MRQEDKRAAIIGFVLGASLAVLAIVAFSAFAAFPRLERRAVYLAVLCPADWRATISQRYDERNRRGIITKSTWITRCV